MTHAQRDSIHDIWGERTPFFGGPWPERVDVHVEEEPDRWVQSCCVLCTNGCGMDIGVKGDRIVGVRGRAVDRVNRGRLGPKGLHAWVANHSPDRLTRPLVRAGDKPGGALRAASWEEAMSRIVQQCRQTIDRSSSGALGFYTTGQLFLEDYYTLSVMVQAGLGTNHLDGNTRLCTATASIALRETFGSDGQPSSIADLDLCDCLVHVGHNIAATQTVSWMRILDRRRGPNPPKLIVIDPRVTPTAREADIHLAPRPATNVAVLNGLMHLVIQNGHIDPEFIERHTTGYARLKATVENYPPERVEEISGIPAAKLREAAQMIGQSERLLCTVLQGVYQSNQASAAACQVNNLALIRGMIGKPGCGVIQSNGQPTAQNTRETGCDGEWAGFRNWQNPRHIQDLARIWNVAPEQLPSWAPKTHALQIFRLAETGTIRFLWIVGTNPAVSLPELHRIRKILNQEKLFVVVQDAFLTETCQFADVVLPAAIWGEKTGTFTNYDRTVHLSYKAVDPPGEAKPDMDIFLDFAQRMNLRDKDGQPLLKWSSPEECFEAWKKCSRGQPCDYSGLSYAKLTGGSGIPWPCNEQHPEGQVRLYEDFRFPTGYDECGDYGHDLETGGHRTPDEYRANDPAGRAILKAADYLPPVEAPDEQYPFWLTTGRVVYHFHTRTKTGRSPQLNQAAPEVFVQINRKDARRLGIKNGDLVEVASRRGTVRGSARLGDIEPGSVFIPFHYGYWDQEDSGDHARAANELTLTAWDPVSKQPQFKFAAVQVSRVERKPLTEKVADLAGKAADRLQEKVDAVKASAHVERSHVPDYLGLLIAAHEEFATACDSLGAQHAQNPEIARGARVIAEFSRHALERLRPFVAKYGEKKSREPRQLRDLLFPGPRSGVFGLLRDLHALFILAAEVHMANNVLRNAAKELRDEALLEVCDHSEEQIERQQAWALTQVQDHAADSLVVPS